MELPKISFGSVPSGEEEGYRRAQAAVSGLSDTVQQGLALYTREMVKSQTQAAQLDLSKRLGSVEQDLRTRQSIPVAEAKARLGAKWDRLDASVREQPLVQVQDPDTGETVERQAEIPTWAIADALFDAEAEKAVTAAGKHVTLGGWRGAFETAAADHLVERRASLQQTQLQAMMHYQTSVRGRQVLEAAEAGDFGPLGDMNDLGGAGAIAQGGMSIFGAAGVEELRQKVRGIKQGRRVEDLLSMADNPDQRPTAIAELREVEKTFSDPTQWNALPREAKDVYQRAVRSTVLQSDAADLVARAEQEPDAGRQSDLILAEKDPDIQRAARELYNARDALRDGKRKEDQRLLGSRLVYKLEERRGHYDLQSDPEWGAADDGTRVIAMERKRALERENRAANQRDAAGAAEARRQQAEENRIARADFDALDPEVKAGPPLVERLPNGRYAPTGELFASADQPTLARINALQSGVRNSFAKGHRVSYDEFRSRVASSLKGKTKTAASEIQAKLDEWYFAESDKRADGAPPDDRKVAEKLIEALEMVDVRMGVDTERIRVSDPSRIRGTLPPEDQWYAPAKQRGAAPAVPGELIPNDPKKPILLNGDGSWSTEQTITIESDGKHLVIPTIVDGKKRSSDEAIALWRSGGNRAVASFKSRAEADAYAEKRHEREQQMRAGEASALLARGPSRPAKPLATNSSQVPPVLRQEIIDEYHAFQRKQGQPEGPVPASEIVRGYNAGLRAGRW